MNVPDVATGGDAEREISTMDYPSSEIKGHYRVAGLYQRRRADSAHLTAYDTLPRLPHALVRADNVRNLVSIYLAFFVLSSLTLVHISLAPPNNQNPDAEGMVGQQEPMSMYSNFGILREY